jgi:hypothetical protein
MNLIKLFLRHYDSNPGLWEGKGLEGFDASVREFKAMRKRRGTTLKEVDERMVTKIGGPEGEGLWPFKTAMDYYDWASSDKHMGGVKR